MNLKSKLFSGLVLLILSILIYGVYNLATFNLFDDETILLSEIKHKSIVLKIYQIPSNATTSSSIQLRKNEKRNEMLISSFDRFNRLDSSKIQNDTLLLYLSAEGGEIQSKTIKINLHSIK